MLAVLFQQTLKALIPCSPILPLGHSHTFPDIPRSQALHQDVVGPTKICLQLGQQKLFSLSRFVMSQHFFTLQKYPKLGPTLLLLFLLLL